MKRRQFLILSTLTLGSSILARYLPVNELDIGDSWNLNCLNHLSPGQTVDLNSGLPLGSPSGGVFFIDQSGIDLPPGLDLSPRGILSVSSNVTHVSVEGVIFGYKV